MSGRIKGNSIGLGSKIEELRDMVELADDKDINLNRLKLARLLRMIEGVLEDTDNLEHVSELF